MVKYIVIDGGADMLRVEVRVFESPEKYEDGDPPLVAYVMDHDNPEERARLGAGCREAFEAGQLVMTYRSWR